MIRSKLKEIFAACFGILHIILIIVVSCVVGLVVWVGYLVDKALS